MICRRLSPLAMLLGALAGSAFAKPIRSTKHGFVIDMPTGWQIAHKDDPADPGKLSATNPENAANITVMIVPISAKDSAAKVLAMMDAKRQSRNELTPDQSKLAKQDLKKIGAIDGVRGQYKQADIVQRIVVVTDKKQAYLLVAAMRHGQETLLSDAIVNAMSSFKLLR